MLESALEAEFSCGRINCAFTGPRQHLPGRIVPRTFRLEAGIVISASHNPY